MQVDVEHRPSFAMARLTLEAGESVLAESGSMVAFDPGLQPKTELNGAGGGGLLLALATAVLRRLLGGETVWVTRFTATGAGQRVWLAPALAGDVEQLALDGRRTVHVQGSSFLAASPGVEVGMVWLGLRMWLSGEGGVFLRCGGTGSLLLNTYGAVEEVAVDGEYVVDSGHVVAFEGDLSWSLGRAGGTWRGALLSGEGLVMTFRGQGRLWLQTRGVQGLVGWITPLLP